MKIVCAETEAGSLKKINGLFLKLRTAIHNVLHTIPQLKTIKTSWILIIVNQS